MKIAYISDLHLEHAPKFQVTNPDNAKVLVLAGDIINTEDVKRFPWGIERDVSSYRYHNSVRYHEFFQAAAELYEHVIYVPGNHEFYDGEYQDVLGILIKSLSEFDNVHCLYNDVILIDDVSFLGATLWTDMNKADPLAMYDAAQRMNDHRAIRWKINNNYGRFSPKQATVEHSKSVYFIGQQIAVGDTQKSVVITHHAPSYRSCNPAFKTSNLNAAYMSNMDEFIENMTPTVWIHGHIHYRSDYMLANTRVLCNPHGYPHELLNPQILTIDI